MIIFGTRATDLKSIETDQPCPSCDKTRTLTFRALSKHVHVFWIPFFPYGKDGFSECSHCRQVLEVKQMPDNLKREYDRLKDNFKTPIWKFSGLALIVILFTWGFFQNKANDKNELIYLNAPAVGDVYKYEVGAGEYSTLKVLAISDDSVFVSQNEYIIERRSKVYKIDKSENYSNYNYGISKAELKLMYDENTIYAIDRD